LLTFSKGGAPVKKPANIKALFQESADFVLQGSNVNLEFNCLCNACDGSNKPWIAEVYSGQISQVVRNLVLNARQAMPDGGAIKITCKLINHIHDDKKLFLKPGNYFLISLEDNGPGIPEGIIDKIFDPYFTTKAEGNGLGLSLTHSIIKKHGGHISAHSKAGQGACFTVYLPAHTGIANMDTVVHRCPASSHKHKGRIMVVDDQEMLREVASAMLEELGYEVVQAEEGRSAIAMYKKALKSENPIDLTILDLTIPGGMGGKETVREILSIKPDAKVIVCSGYSTDSAMARYKDFGFRAAINKPYKFEDLEEAIISVL
jgi:CheY-like chemotaxis protein